jgi:hypothetical protein
MNNSPRLDDIETRGLYQAIINGGFDFWQRGTGPYVQGDVYCADRWFKGDNGALVYEVNRSTDVPNNGRSTYSLEAEVTTAGSPASSETYRLQHNLEGHFFKPLFGKTVVFDFWVKASLTGTYAFGFGADLSAPVRRGYATEYTVDQANVWERKRIEIDFSSENINDYILDNGLCIGLFWGLGEDKATRATSTLDQFQTIPTFYTGTTGSIQWIETLGATFKIAQVMCYEKPVDENFVPDFVTTGRNYVEELQLCQRYYYRLEPVANGIQIGFGISFSNPTDNCEIGFKLPIELRDVPVFIINGNYICYGAGTTRNIASVVAIQGMTGNIVTVQMAADGSFGGIDVITLRSIANSANYISFEAEL